MLLREAIAVIENYRIFMTNAFAPKGSPDTIFITEPLTKEEKNLKVKEIYSDCGINIELKFDKAYWKYTTRRKI